MRGNKDIKELEIWVPDNIDTNLLQWVNQNAERLEFVMENGRTATVRAQAEILLEIQGVENGER